MTIHNLRYYHRLMAELRTAIEAGTLAHFARTAIDGWESN